VSDKYLGLDLGGTNIKFVVIEKNDVEWKILLKNQISTEAIHGPEFVTNRLAELANRLCKENEIKGLGLAVPGIFDLNEGTISLFPNLPGNWRGYQIGKPISEVTGLKVGLINDARAFSLAESVMGAARGYPTVACIVMGTGVGGGVVIDGKVHLGATKGAGEIAHQIVNPDGPLCGCGSQGCVEAMTSSDAIAKLAGVKTPEEAYERAIAGDKQAIHSFEEAGKWIGIAMANVMAVLSPDIFVLGGGVSQSGNLITKYALAEAKRRSHLFEGEVFKIVPAQLGVYAGAIGAALNGATLSGDKFSRISTT
jgi:glucokinase